MIQAASLMRDAPSISVLRSSMHAADALAGDELAALRDPL